MKAIVFVLSALALGLSAPASASAGGLQTALGQVLDAQILMVDDTRDDRGRKDDRGKPAKSDRENGDRARDNTRDTNRGDDRSVQRPRAEPNRNGGGEDRYPRADERAYQPTSPRGLPIIPYQQPGESWRPAPPTGREISMAQAIRIVEMTAGPGHHLDGNREERGGRTYYRIQWATDRGERRDFYVDAQTGALMGR